MPITGLYGVCVRWTYFSSGFIALQIALQGNYTHTYIWESSTAKKELNPPSLWHINSQYITCNRFYFLPPVEASKHTYEYMRGHINRIKSEWNIKNNTLYLRYSLNLHMSSFQFDSNGLLILLPQHTTLAHTQTRTRDSCTLSIWTINADLTILSVCNLHGMQTHTDTGSGPSSQRPTINNE